MKAINIVNKIDKNTITQEDRNKFDNVVIKQNENDESCMILFDYKDESYYKEWCGRVNARTIKDPKMKKRYQIDTLIGDYGDLIADNSKMIQFLLKMVLFLYEESPKKTKDKINDNIKNIIDDIDKDNLQIDKDNLNCILRILNRESKITEITEDPNNNK